MKSTLARATVQLGLTICLFFTGPPAKSAAAAHLREWTAQELLGARTITETQISPDGTQVLYVVSRADVAANSYQSSIWIVGTNGRAPRELTSGTSPKWSLDGTRLAYLSSAAGAPQIWIIPAHHGAARRLTHVNAGVTDFAWSPDGMRIGFLAAQSGGEPSSVVRIVDSALELPQLYVIAADGGGLRRLTNGRFMVEDFDWSPNGREIAITTRKSPRTSDDYQTGIFVLNVSNGSMRPIVKPPGRNVAPKWSHDGTHIAFLSTGGETGEYASAHVDVVLASGGTAQDVSPDVGERVYDFYGWTPDDKALCFRVRRAFTMQVLCADAHTAKTAPFTAGEAIFDGMSFSQAPEPRVAFVESSPQTPSDLYISSLARFNPFMVVRANPKFAGLRREQVRIVHWSGRDGLPIEGRLDLPVGYRKGTRYPTVVILHGGPSGGFTIGFAPQLSAIGVPVQFETYPPQLFTQAGFAVLMPNIRGGGGYGEAFRKADVMDWGGEDLQDVLRGVDQVVREGIADPQRLGVMGWSYGGFLTSFMITQTNRFKVASVGAGVSDMVSMFGTTDQPDQTMAYFGGPPWMHPSLYHDRSAISFANRIHTPTLIQHGDDDPDVSPTQADELYRALVTLGVPVEYARYPHAGHNPTVPKQNVDVWTRNLAWFRRWLKAP